MDPAWKNYILSLKREIETEICVSRLQLVRKVPFAFQEPQLSASSAENLNTLLHREFSSRLIPENCVLAPLRLCYSYDPSQGMLFLDFLHVPLAVLRSCLLQVEIASRPIPSSLDAEGSVCLGQAASYLPEELKNPWLELDFGVLV